MKKILLFVFMIVTLATSSVQAQCDFTTKINFHNNFMEIVDSSSFWFTGVQFVAYDEMGRVIGRSPLPSPSPAVRPSYFPLRVYGDDATTPILMEGPSKDDIFFITSNLMQNCGVIFTDSIVAFNPTWGVTTIVSFQHPGDIDKNHKIDMVDYKLVSKAVQMQKYFGIYDCKCDVNADGVVNALDQGMMAQVVLYKNPKVTLGKWDYGCM